jgi:hypothetical protein
VAVAVVAAMLVAGEVSTLMPRRPISDWLMGDGLSFTSQGTFRTLLFIGGERKE